MLWYLGCALGLGVVLLGLWVLLTMQQVPYCRRCAWRVPHRH